jgi:hypothetical protein
MGSPFFPPDMSEGPARDYSATASLRGERGGRRGGRERISPEEEVGVEWEVVNGRVSASARQARARLRALGDWTLQFGFPGSGASSGFWLWITY